MKIEAITMDSNGVPSRSREFFVRGVFFLLGAYAPAVSLWWASVEPALYATHDLTSWAMFKVIFGYISAIVLGGMLGLGVLRLIRIRQQKALRRWPRTQKTKKSLSPKQRWGRGIGLALACILALGVGWIAFLEQTLVWVAIPGASIQVDNRPSPASGVYTTWNGQMLVSVPSNGEIYSYVIDPLSTREDAPAMCERGDPFDEFVVRSHIIQVEIDDSGDSARGCEGMPGLEVLVDPELRLQPYKMTFITPYNQRVEISFWHL